MPPPPKRSPVLLLGAGILVAVGLFLFIDSGKQLAEIQEFKRSSVAGLQMGPVLRGMSWLGGRLGSETLQRPQRNLESQEALVGLEQAAGIALAVFGGLGVLYAVAQPGPPTWLTGLMWLPTLLTVALFLGGATVPVPTIPAPATAQAPGRPQDAPGQSGLPARPPAPTPIPQVTAIPPTTVSRHLLLKGSLTVPFTGRQGQTVILSVAASNGGRPDDLELDINAPNRVKLVDDKFLGSKQYTVPLPATGTYEIVARNPSLTRTRDVTVTYQLR